MCRDNQRTCLLGEYGVENENATMAPPTALFLAPTIAIGDIVNRTIRLRLTARVRCGSNIIMTTLVHRTSKQSASTLAIDVMVTVGEGAA